MEAGYEELYEELRSWDVDELVDVFVWMLVKEDRRIFDLILAEAFLDVLYEKNALPPDFDMKKAHERFREAERKRRANDHDAGGN